VVAALLLCASGCGGEEDSSSSQTQGTAAVAVEEGEGDGKDAASRAEGDHSSSPSSSGFSKHGASAKQGKTSSDTDSSPQSSKPSKVSIPKGEPEPTQTAQQKAQATVTDMTLYSPDLPRASTSPLPATYTCDGQDSWPRLSWQGTPPGTAELALLVMNSQPIEDKVFFDWAVAGIDPSISGLEAGKLPKGAVVGKNSFGKVGYSICPPPQSRESYVLLLYALPKSLDPKRGFEPLAFREATLAISGNAGLMAVSYARG
jgi:phosphatidylethanolamine-binding protein (PEBP) family uncharacterized protein